jgi:FkbM family methyltransferase
MSWQRCEILTLMLRRIRLLLENENLRNHPVRGISRRILWRMRWWLLSNEPWLMISKDSTRLLTVRGGVGALLYYDGGSEPEVTEFIKRVLRPGMTFVDVGAHLGEHALLAAKIVEDSGHVHAFEPRPDVFELLTRSIELNHRHNVTAVPDAVWCKRDSCDFEMTEEPSVSALRPYPSSNCGSALIRVPTTTLDDYFSSSTTRPNLIKVDVEGAELQVFQGAKSLLTRAQAEAPVLVFEYGPKNSQQFGYAAPEALAFLRELGYTIFTWDKGNLSELEGSPTLRARQETCNLMAMKMRPPVTSKLDVKL